MAGAVAAALDFCGTTSADDLGMPPPTEAPQVLSITDDARPIENPAPSTAPLRTQSSRSPITRRPSSAQWSTSGQSEVADTDTAWKLRWRKPSVAAEEFAAGPKPLTVSRAVVWNQPNVSNAANVAHDTAKFPVRAASQQAPVDPFEEPYSGQPVTTQEPALSTPAPGNAAELQPPTAPDPFNDPPAQPALPQPAVPQPDLPMETQPQPVDPGFPREERDMAPVPPPSLGMPDSITRPNGAEVPCERTYNSRNCCTEDAKCKEAQDFVTQHKISNILLDITPSFTNTETAIPTDLRKERELSQAPSRVWKDRNGSVIAEGFFKDYRNGTVHVLSTDNQSTELAFNTLSDDDRCFVTAWWSLPSECSLSPQPYHGRQWLASTFTWKASALCHKPLYFEEVALERYGHSMGPIKQPFLSGAHFFGSLIALPYQMGIHPPNECQYALGYYRPGSCAPWLVPPVPISLRGAMVAAGAYIGGVYFIP